VSGTFDELMRRWTRLKEASAIMCAGPFPTWPHATDDSVFLAQQRRRDAVQARGMAFADEWHARAGDVTAIVAAMPTDFAAYHIVEKGKTPPVPTDYSQSNVILPILERLRAEGTI
jgi:hypothetical protein